MARSRDSWRTFALLLLLVLVISRCQSAQESGRTPGSSQSASPGETSGSLEATIAARGELGPLVPATVSRNVDGDTIHVKTAAGVTEKVRFIGVNTPESTIEHQPYGKESSDYTKRRLPVGTKVWLETDIGLRDRYGRLLAYIWLSPPASASAAEIRAKMFNAELLIEGYAQLMTIPPDVKYVDFFTPLQAEARDANLGLWGLPVK